MKNALMAFALIGSTVAVAPRAAQADTKLAFVDLQRALEETEDGKKAKNKLKTEFERKQKELDSKSEELKKAKEEFDKKAPLMKPEALAKHDRRAREDRPRPRAQQLGRLGPAVARHHQRGHSPLQRDGRRLEAQEVMPGFDLPLQSAQIAALLPHRYPFLLVDRVVEATDDKLVAWKNVTSNEPFFVGHFPGHPVMPGVLILEALAQAGALLALRSASLDVTKQAVYLLGIDKAKFRKLVVPGDRLVLTVEPLRKGGKIWKLAGKATVDDQVVAEAELLATIADRA
jgi:3-hydroxyacyl-[acyl-carrier-protein] dehydratase